ncbi:hypothetical protein QSV34_08780 [Porticoccus sp. W117]|uniref:hypothetical protein n=1 Tax=Porticoccus sp. W117 TaxID=3054777 RepID=UPI0025998C3F|nr:hypothetical protein [Porticoccus sp. W117]MDM3871448.1 hypothetical protein [Porticoccus sp. W117]
MKKHFAVCIFLFVVSQLTFADIPLSENTELVFASKKQAGKLLAQKDDYTQRLSQFDLTAKLQRKSPATVKQFLSFARKQGMNWEKEEKQRLGEIFQSLQAPLAPYVDLLPEKVYLVKTTGRVESGALYTRGNNIYIPARNMAMGDDQLTTIMLHELFHIITRNNPELRDRLYAAIGFVKTSELVLPEPLRSRKISNPDVPVLSHLIKVTIEGKERWVTPIIYSGTDYDRAIKRVFFQYLKLAVLVYDWDGSGEPSAAMENGKPLLVPLGQVAGLFEQIGRNAQTVFHPEEVLADNFALLVRGHRVASPEVLDKMRKAFAR